MPELPTYKDVARARETVGDRVKVTPLLTSASLSGITRANLVVKALELLELAGARDDAGAAAANDARSIFKRLKAAPWLERLERATAAQRV